MSENRSPHSPSYRLQPRRMRAHFTTVLVFSLLVLGGPMVASEMLPPYNHPEERLSFSTPELDFTVDVDQLRCEPHTFMSPMQGWFCGNVEVTQNAFFEISDTERALRRSARFASLEPALSDAPLINSDHVHLLIDEPTGVVAIALEDPSGKTTDQYHITMIGGDDLPEVVSRIWEAGGGDELPRRTLLQLEDMDNHPYKLLPDNSHPGGTVTL